MDSDNELYQSFREALQRSLSCFELEVGESVLPARELRPYWHREALFAQLVRVCDQEGISDWNARAPEEIQQVDFSDCDFANCRWKGISLRSLNMQNITFDSGDLSKSDLYGSDLSNSSLVKADLTGAKFSWACLREANLSEANLTKTSFDNAYLTDAIMTNANVKGANFKAADVCGVDLTSFNANEAKTFQKARYNSRTTLPADFPDLASMVWQDYRSRFAVESEAQSGS